MVFRLFSSILGLIFCSQTVASEAGALRSYISVSYVDVSGDYTSSGTINDIDFDGYALGGLFYLDTLDGELTPIVVIQHTDLQGSTTNLQTENTAVAVGFALGGVDYAEGLGNEFQFFASLDDESSSNFNFKGIFGLGGGASLYAGYYTNVSDDLIDTASGISTGLDFGVTENVILSAEYMNEDADFKDGGKLEGRTWSVGFKYFLD